MGASSGEWRVGGGVDRSSSRPETGAVNWGSSISSRRQGLGVGGGWEERGCVMASVCPAGRAMGPLGDLGQKASLLPPHITVPFKATQHLFPPIKTNNLFCRKSRQLSSAGAEA